ncbi:MAG: hypothetical protein Edafosvirus54_3 [Edafosvirus sp.]|uniref:Protein kinase domain-containing protein n=1 Tax=Edafosvirus sp. TaxID=2487765 RepID=A0A3G4ZVK2_9VIRU|nr:MAG: hypothetical protein Edafosvirus54_3 [Edafosvirus sp.]
MTTIDSPKAKYELKEQIGTGSSCIVYRAISKDGKEYAVKIIKLEKDADPTLVKDKFDTALMHEFYDEAECIYNEIMMTKRLKHHNIIEIYDSFVTDKEVWIIMELETNSCLSIIKSLHPSGIKNEVLIATILKYTLLAIEYCHLHDQIHRDIKAANILINKSGVVKLADFGAGALLVHDGIKDATRTSFIGTPCWMAPEIFLKTGYTNKIDIWSFGVTILELAFGRVPFCFLEKVTKLDDKADPFSCYKDQKNTFSKCFIDIVLKCLHHNPEDRPTAKELLGHKFFKQARDEKYILDNII